MTDADLVAAHGYTVAPLDSGFGPVRGQWILLDPDGASLMIGDHGGVAPTKRDAIAEALERIRS